MKAAKRKYVQSRLRLTRAELELIRDAASAAGLTSGRWARDRLTAAAKEELEPDADTPTVVETDAPDDEE
jgi:hypothetical protein